jgi:hypothetical protein
LSRLFGTLNLLPPDGHYRFRADKDGAHFRSGEANHCTVLGCTTITVARVTTYSCDVANRLLVSHCFDQIVSQESDA